MIYWGVTERAVSEFVAIFYLIPATRQRVRAGIQENAVIYSTRFRDISECLCVQGCDFDYDAAAF